MKSKGFRWIITTLRIFVYAPLICYYAVFRRGHTTQLKSRRKGHAEKNKSIEILLHLTTSPDTVVVKIDDIGKCLYTPTEEVSRNQKQLIIDSVSCAITHVCIAYHKSIGSDRLMQQQLFWNVPNVGWSRKRPTFKTQWNVRFFVVRRDLQWTVPSLRQTASLKVSLKQMKSKIISCPIQTSQWM